MIAAKEGRESMLRSAKEKETAFSPVCNRESTRPYTQPSRSLLFWLTPRPVVTLCWLPLVPGDPVLVTPRPVLTLCWLPLVPGEPVLVTPRPVATLCRLPHVVW